MNVKQTKKENKININQKPNCNNIMNTNLFFRRTTLQSHFIKDQISHITICVIKKCKIQNQFGNFIDSSLSFDSFIYCGNNDFI